jgi:hypothetical protein
MAGAGENRLVVAALRCYPARWRRRHGVEAAELAALLIRDGAAPGSIALSYLAGAVRERLVARPGWLPRPGRRLSTVACALLVAACSIGVSAGLLASAAPARAASTTGVHGATSTGNATGHTHCVPGPGTGVTPATARPRAFSWEAGYGRAC